MDMGVCEGWDEVCVGEDGCVVLFLFSLYRDVILGYHNTVALCILLYQFLQRQSKSNEKGKCNKSFRYKQVVEACALGDDLLTFPSGDATEARSFIFCCLEFVL